MPTKRVLALVDRQAATRERLSGNLLALLARLWAALTTGQRYDDAQVAAFAAQAAALSKGARTAASAGRRRRTCGRSSRSSTRSPAGA
jgi:hypothetical protein